MTKKDWIEVLVFIAAGAAVLLVGMFGDFTVF